MRGVFRSNDGGKTWQKVLFKDNKTGAIDLVFDPNNPHILFAALWEAQRTPWSLTSGGPGSGLYKSSDDGATWKRLDGRVAERSAGTHWRLRFRSGWQSRLRDYRSGKGRHLPQRGCRRELEADQSGSSLHAALLVFPSHFCGP